MAPNSEPAPDLVGNAGGKGTVRPNPPRKRPSRPNFNQVHSQPLPLAVHPLPAFIPHNPLSLLRIISVYLFQLFPWSKPTSHPERYKAWLSRETGSVHVTDETAMRALWEKGFFGKGSLSRSEATWLARERERIKRKREGSWKSAEEATRKRREERKEFKKERARKEREAVMEQRKLEGRNKQSGGQLEQVDSNGNVSESRTVRFVSEEASSPKYVPTNSEDHAASIPLEGTVTETSPQGAHKADSVPLSPPTLSPQTNTVLDGLPGNGDETSGQAHQQLTLTSPEAKAVLAAEDTIADEEHLQLTPEEAFFLAYALGILDIYDGQASRIPMSTSDLFDFFSRSATFPPQAGSLDDTSFLASYAVYHHFRSLGWVVRPGMKFGVDMLLYNRGPVFAHAEFGVMIIPSLRSADKDDVAATDAVGSGKKMVDSSPVPNSYQGHDMPMSSYGIQGGLGSRKNWWWLHCVNRVQTQVKKTLVLAYVEIDPSTERENEDGRKIDIGRMLKRCHVREFILRRWVPNRSRQ
ncbi:tRNA intron endonuclease [Lineolata rhizophorae]|uniref:tRNA-intron lyase n=1 Tax=Lineolata rhizophorae TaxID=578093 RepID=A0A6A6NV29_9PEZI|nr:tRNA intron endonuclease [Lineolata rhizophorae]